MEPAILTAGSGLPEIARFLDGGKKTYSAADVLAYLAMLP